MKLVYKNLTICSKAEGSIPVCDTTCVPQLQENLMNSTLQLYLLLDTIYAGYMQVTLQRWMQRSSSCRKILFSWAFKESNMSRNILP
ncbi:hypothetical protein MKD14_18285 [[Clostridium] innocuum]|nr:hypothetical protein [[Clostridium] innocuum]